MQNGFWGPIIKVSSLRYTVHRTIITILLATHEVLFCYSHPNNPTGELRKPLVQDKSHVMYDMVYYWPAMYIHTY